MKVTELVPSTTVTYAGAVDACVILNGVEYGVTLIPDQLGELDMWGTERGHWIGGPGFADLTLCQLHDIVDAVCAAWKASR